MADHVSIARTGKGRTFRGWQDSGLSFDAYFQPGDRRGPNGSARYSTFVCCGGYYYAGYQPANTITHIA